MRPTEAALGTVALTKNRVAPVALHDSRSRSLLVLAVILAAAGCSQFSPSVPPSEGHIVKPPVKVEADKGIPPPARVSTFVPAPKPAVKPQTYSVVVNEVPVKDLLLALARDTKQNIDVHPGLAGLVSLNAINETLPAILERVSKQADLRYRREGNTIIVSPDVPYVKTYRVPYVDMQRNSSAQIGVTGQITASGTGSQSQSGEASGSASSTLVTTKINTDFYQTLRDNLKGILLTMRSQSLTAEGRRQRQQEQKAAMDLEGQRLQAASSAANAVARSGVTLGSSTAVDMMRLASAGMGGVTAARVEDDVIVNSQSGTVTVSATDREHQVLQQHIDSILRSTQRQVLIEATIAEVALSDSYQGGINWERLASGGGPNINLTAFFLGGFVPGPGAPVGNAVTIATTSSAGNINAVIKLLQEFGDTRVLSSPKLMALNNQTALLKVVDNVVYFEVQSTPPVVSGLTITPGTTNTTAKTVAVGVVMSVTPQINEDGRVLMTVRPTITRLNPRQPFVNDPNPILTTVPNLIPQVQTREMESVLQIGSGQTVILGGLMQDDVQRNRSQLPGAGALGSVGELFGFRSELAAKTELVIFLRPTIITNPSLDSDELRFFQRFLPQLAPPPQQPERTGAAQ